MYKDKIEKLAKKTAGFQPTDGENYGSIFVVAAILAIVYHSILIIRLWRNRRRNRLIMGLRERGAVSRNTRKLFGRLGILQRQYLTDEICKIMEEMTEEDIKDLIANPPSDQYL
jgi:hypothetical protein